MNWTRNIGTHIDQAHKAEWHNLLSSTGIGLILRSIKIDYKFVSRPQPLHCENHSTNRSAVQPMKFPDKVTVYQKLIYDPSSSLSSQSAFQLQVMILSEARQRPAARCHEDIVTYDYKKNRKTPELPPFIFEQFKAIWELQEKAKQEWQQRILEIEGRVRSLETDSWDRPDAIEDTGSGKQ